MTEQVLEAVEDIVEDLPDVSQGEVLFALGMAHILVKAASKDEERAAATRLLDATEAEAEKRGVPQEVREVVKSNAELGRFVEE